MSVLRIGSLCSGYGGLDLAVMDVLGGTVAWHAQYDPDDKHQYAARILEHRFPGVPNHGDITAVDWTTVEPVDVLTAGFPCQPISHAGLRKAQDDARWIWPAVARAVRTLRPRLVVLENVSALVVRGLSDVLGDLAAIRFDAEWLCLPASDVGAPHKRERCFVLAWPASDAGCDPWPQDHSDFGSAAGRGRGTGVPSVALGGRAAAPAATGIAEREPADDENPVAGSREARPELGGRSLPDRERERERGRRRDQAAADPPHDGRERGRESRLGWPGPAHHDQNPDVDWGPYTAAVRRWEAVMGPAPAPTETGKNGPRLAPALPEWMMGAPPGWVTGVPGVPRNAQLHAIGNGVVRQQGAEAMRILMRRAALAGP